MLRRGRRALRGLAFVAGFSVTLVGTRLAIAALVAAGRGQALHRSALVSAVLLVAAGVLLLVESATKL